MTDIITISTGISKMKRDGSRFTIRHVFTKEEEQVCAIITLDAAWIDTKLRKLVNPVPQIVSDALNHLPKTTDFVWL